MKNTKADMVEDEIDLRELFMVLWKKSGNRLYYLDKRTILTGLASALLLNSGISFRRDHHNHAQSYTTKYGNMHCPTTNEQYIDLITSSDVIRKTIEDMGLMKYCLRPSAKNSN